MSPRRTRIDKVITVREKALDDRVAKLALARAAEAQAKLLEEQQKRQLEEASESRLKLAEEGTALRAASWIEANEWLHSRLKHHERARLDTQKAQLDTRKAQGEVMTARSDLKKVELLSARIAQQEEHDANVTERRLEDELTSLRFRRSDEGK